MSTKQHPPGPVRQAFLHEIEFYELQSTTLRDVFDVQREMLVRARLLDPRLQRIISAAAKGWVIERLR